MLDMATRADVPDELVVDFDLYDLPGATHDLTGGFLHFKNGYPDIFWTPRNGGHWVTTNPQHILTVQSDSSRFSSKRITVPKPTPETITIPPLERDAPEHTDLRRPVSRALLPKMIDKMEDKVRERSVRLIEKFVDRGECDFVSEFCQVLPVSVFLDLVDLPQEDAKKFMPHVERVSRAKTLEVRDDANLSLAALIRTTVLERRANPGTDLISQIASIDVVGEKISEDEACLYGVLLLNAGLDTTLSLLALSMRFLANNPAHRQEILSRIDDKAFMRNVVEELVRISPVAVIGREVMCDTTLGDVKLKAGDMILAPSVYLNFDENHVTDPYTVNFSRKFPIPHTTFGSGPHICPGSFLARREVQILLEEWLPRIPDFSIKPGTAPTFETGSVNQVKSLDLVW